MDDSTPDNGAEAGQGAPSPCALFAFDDDGRILRANRELQALIGDGGADPVGRSIDDFLTGNARLHFHLDVHPTLTREGRVESEILAFQTPHGEVAALFSAARIARGGAAVNEACAVRLRARSDLEDTLIRVRKAADMMPGAIFQLLRRPDGFVAMPYASAGLFELFGARPAEVRHDARAVIAAVAAEDRAMLKEALVRSAQTLTSRTVRFRVAAPGRAERWCECHAKPERRPDGATLWHGYVFDVTERRSMEILVRDKDASDRASRAKSEFLANMSHEIRTPMNAILGYTQLLQRDPRLRPEQQQYLSTIARSGDHLLDLLNDILEMSKIEAGHRQLRPTDFDMWALCEDLGRMFQLRADAKGLTFAVERRDSVPRYLRADESKLRQMMINLLGNAVKFTSSGGVAARAFTRPGSRGELRLVIEVTDTGPGIGAEDLEKLFRPFAQAGMVANGGTGLGLSISREVARMMGGDITVESRVGKGSTFHVDVAVEPGREPGRAAAAATRRGRVTGLRGDGPVPRILVVDDDEDDRRWVRLLLADVGFEVCEAGDGAAALAAIESARPALVLLDMHMPVLDGYAVLTTAARAADRPRLVALTASAFDEERDAILAAGADAVLRKPCRATDMFEEIVRQLGVKYVYAEGEPPPASRRAAPAAKSLPADVLSALKAAVRIADYEQLLSVIDDIPAEHAAAAHALRSLAERYDYEALGRWLPP